MSLSALAVKKEKGFGGRVKPRGPASFTLSGVDWGQDQRRLNREARKGGDHSSYWQTPMLSAFSKTLSTGKRFARPGFLSVNTWKAILRDVGFTGASTAGLAVLTNSLDHQMETIVKALKTVKDLHPTKKIFGVDEQMLNHFISSLQQLGVADAGKDYNLPAVPDMWRDIGAGRRVGKPITAETRKRLDAQHVLPSICTKAAGFLKRFQSYVGLKPDDDWPGERVWGKYADAWERFKVNLNNEPVSIVNRLVAARLVPDKWGKEMIKAGLDITGLNEWFTVISGLAVDIVWTRSYGQETFAEAKTNLNVSFYITPDKDMVWVVKNEMLLFPTPESIHILGYITRFLSPKDMVFFLTVARGNAVPDESWATTISKIMEGTSTSSRERRDKLLKYSETLNELLPRFTPSIQVTPFLNQMMMT